MNLEGRVNNLLKKGIYNPDELFKIVYSEFPVHYSRVREAIHLAKTK